MKSVGEASWIWNMTLAIVWIMSTAGIVGGALEVDPLIIGGAFVGFYTGNGYLQNAIEIYKEKRRRKEEDNDTTNAE